MSRLPTPGGDVNDWGSILNEFLNASHNQDGSLRPTAVSNLGVEMTSNKGKPNGYASLDTGGKVPLTQLPASASQSIAGASDATISNPTRGQVLAYDSASSKWTNKSLGNFNVKDFGAVGDGTADDTSAIQATINAAGINGGTVAFPEGTFRFSSLSLSGLSNVRLLGSVGSTLATSAMQSTQDIPGGTHNCFLLINNCMNVVVEHLRILGQYTTGDTGSYSDAICISGNSDNVTVRGCEFSAIPGEVLFPTQSTKNIRFIENYSHDIENSGFANYSAVGILASGNVIESCGLNLASAAVSINGEGVDFSGNLVLNCPFTGIQIGHSGADAIGPRITRNLIKGAATSSGAGIALSYGIGILISDNVFSTWQYGINASSWTGSGCTVRDNRFTSIDDIDGTGGLAISSFYNTPDVNIIGNRIEGGGTCVHGIYCASSSNSSPLAINIQHNCITSVTANAIYVTQSITGSLAGTRINDNYIAGCSRGIYAAGNTTGITIGFSNYVSNASVAAITPSPVSISGSRSGGEALTNLLTSLADMGVITDTTTT